MNTIVLIFLVYMAVLWVSIALMYFQRMSFSIASVQEYYLGSPARFTEPRSYQSLLEVSHAHLFSMGMLAVTLTHLLLFAPVSSRLKVYLSLAVYVGAIGDEASGWLIRFVSPHFAFLKIFMFVLLEGSLLALMLIVISGLILQRRHQRNERGRTHPRRRRGRSAHDPSSASRPIES